MKRKFKPKSIPKLYSVPTALIHVDENRLRPTWWDNRVVRNDLIDYTNRSRIVRATPEVCIVKGRIILINGEPFLNAANSANPPIIALICAADASEGIFGHGVVEIALSELTADMDRSWNELSLHALYFSGMLSSNNVNVASDILKQAVVSQMDSCEQKIDIEEKDGRTILIWKMRPWCIDDVRVRKFVNTLETEIDQLAPISSWNGSPIRRPL